MKKFLSKTAPFLLLLLAAAALIAGIFAGDMELVMQKAVRICLECIGIG